MGLGKWLITLRMQIPRDQQKVNYDKVLNLYWYEYEN